MPSPATWDRTARERAVWWTVAVAFVVAGSVWAFAIPLFTGPDEASQARRAAAVVRGELTGRQERPGPPLLLAVDVPPLYGEPAEQNWLCHLGPLVPGAPQEAMLLPSPPCPDLRAPLPEPVTELVEAETVQYRGQPFFYALAGAPTLLSDGVTGAYAMRLVVVVLTAVLVASAAATVVGGGHDHGRLAGLGLLTCLTPGVVYLSASTNPSAVEIAAALSAWASVGALASRPPDGEANADVGTGRLIARLGVALVVLTLCRGLGPGFAAAVVAGGALIAGRHRSLTLLRRNDVRWWAAAVAVATVASLAWLAHIGSAFPLPDRAGSGLARAASWLPWYLHQSIGVFGTNDSAVAPIAAALWCVVTLGVFTIGAIGLWWQGSNWQGSNPAKRCLGVATLVLVCGLALNVTAEGLSIPPIGFFWQGRYALPLLLGGIVLATSPPDTRRPIDSSTSSTSAEPPADSRATSRPATSAVGAIVGATALLVAVHVHALWVVTAHHGTPTGATRGVALLSYAASLAVMASALVYPRTRLRPHPEERP